MNFYIYEQDKHTIFYCKEIINKVFFSRNLSYQVFEEKEFHPHLDDKNKVILIDPTMDNAETFIKELRESGDYHTPIICLLSEKDMLYYIEHNCSLWFSTLCIKNKEFEEQLKIRLLHIIQFFCTQPSLSLCQEGELFKVPYQDILYIEKELHSNQCLVVTLHNRFSIRSSVKKMEDDLKDVSFFFKCHQSCIINLQNVIRIDFSSNKIYFENEALSLLSRSKRKELKMKYKLYHS